MPTTCEDDKVRVDAVSTTARNAVSAVWRLVDDSEGLLGVKDPEISQWRNHLLGGLHQTLDQRRDFGDSLELSTGKLLKHLD